ncbi:MAG: hypothetical protein ACE14M_03880 [Terriglobales bacterium]
MKSAVVRSPSVSEIAGVVRASELQHPPAPMVPCGIAAVDELTGGIPRGALTEIFGPASSGRTSLMLALLAQMTSHNEVCALVDASDAFDPHSAAAAGANLERLLWVRCGKNTVSSFQFRVSKTYARQNLKLETGNRKLDLLEQALKATDLLLQGGGFGLVIMDFGDVPPQLLRRVPLTSWFRFRRAVEHTPTVLLVIGQESCAKTCASLVLQTVARNQMQIPRLPPANGGPPDTRDDTTLGHSFSEAALDQREQHNPAHTRILAGLQTEITVVRSRISVVTARPPKIPPRFESRTSWAG